MVSGRNLARPSRRAAARAVATAAVASTASLPLCAGALRGQGSTLVAGGRLADWTAAAVGSEEENYLRVLQVAGVARARPWTLRPFGPGELRGLVPRDARHPWQARTFLGDSTDRHAAFSVIGPAAGVAWNSDIPFGYNDAEVWTGRGTTAVVRGGVAARWRWFSVRLEPTAFWSANRPYALVSNGQDGPLRFADPLEPMTVDAPQRFGDRAIGRVSLGQSTVRVDVAGLTAGLSTASQWLGPALQDPQVLGNNAGGYPRLFLGTGRPVSLGVGTLHVQLQSGRLGQSAWSPMPRDSADRLAAALAAVITVRGVPGLELGGTRFFHEFWRDNERALERLSAVGQNPFLSGDGTAFAQNQLVSLWGRWVVPQAGLEVWGEFMRNDASADLRDALVEPDHNSGYTVGARRIWRRGSGALSAVRLEFLNDRITHLARVRGQTRAYQHGTLRQGHTERGQLLGSVSGLGGLANTLGFDQYDERGRLTFEYSRRVVASGLVEAAPRDQWNVLHALRAERLRFGRRGDLFAGAAALLQLNRWEGRDSFGVRLDAGWRFGALPRTR